MWTTSKIRVIALASCGCAMLTGTIALMADTQQIKPSPAPLLKVMERAKSLEIDYSESFVSASIDPDAKDRYVDYSISDPDTIKAFRRALKNRLDDGILKKVGGRLLQATFVDVRVLADADEKQPLATIMLYPDALVFTVDGETYYYKPTKGLNQLYLDVVRKDLQFGQRADQQVAD